MYPHILLFLLRLSLWKAEKVPNNILELEDGYGIWCGAYNPGEATVFLDSKVV